MLSHAVPDPAGASAGGACSRIGSAPKSRVRSPRSRRHLVGSSAIPPSVFSPLRPKPSPGDPLALAKQDVGGVVRGKWLSPSDLVWVTGAWSSRFDEGPGLTVWRGGQWQGRWLSHIHYACTNNAHPPLNTSPMLAALVTSHISEALCVCQQHHFSLRLSPTHVQECAQKCAVGTGALAHASCGGEPLGRPINLLDPDPRASWRSHLGGAQESSPRGLSASVWRGTISHSAPVFGRRRSSRSSHCGNGSTLSGASAYGSGWRRIWA